MNLAERVAARYQGPLPTAQRKTAAFPPRPPGEEGSTQQRTIPKDHPFDKRALKPLSKALWASTVALGHALTAYRHLSRLKSTTVSPDGLMGGTGYVMKLGDMRQKLFEASEALSSISDTIFDEIQAPHWKPRLAQLDEDDQKDVNHFVEEAQDVMENPEGEAEEGIQEIEKASEADSSSLPQADEAQAEVETEKTPDFVKQASTPSFNLDVDPETPYLSTEHAVAARFLQGNSSLPVSELPGGPRVDHIGPGTGDGPYGDFSDPGELDPVDQWSADGGGSGRRDETGEDYDYPSGWENDMSTTADSSIPDSDTDSTPTDAWDFGIGYGAKGDGAGDYGNPSDEGGGKGVWGPHSGLPGTPSQSSGDSTTEVLDDKLNFRQAQNYIYGLSALPFQDSAAESLFTKLPQDDAAPVARSDYYTGEKDNLVSVGTAELPSPDRAEGESAPSLVDTYVKTEDLATDYQRYDNISPPLREPGGDHPGQNHQEPWAPDGEATR